MVNKYLNARNAVSELVNTSEPSDSHKRGLKASGVLDAMTLLSEQ